VKNPGKLKKITFSSVAPIGHRAGIHATHPKSSPITSATVTSPTKTASTGFHDVSGLFSKFGPGGTDPSKIGSSSGTPLGNQGNPNYGNPVGGSGGSFNINRQGPPTDWKKLSDAQVKERFGLSGLGSVFTGELEALFGELGEWEKPARTGYHIFGGEGKVTGLPQNVAEAYLGLQQGLDSLANQVTEIQVMDEQTAFELGTSVGATVYYGVDSTGNYVRLDPSPTLPGPSGPGGVVNTQAANHRELIRQKEILDTYRPFAMSRVQNAIEMKDEITLQAIQDAFVEKREVVERKFQLAKTEQEQLHSVNLASSTTRAKGVEARKTAQVTGQEDRASLQLKYKMEAEEAEKSHARDLEIMEATLWNEQEKLRASTESSKYLGQLNWELDMASTEQKQAFAANQASLDRSLRLGEMEQAGNLQLQANILQAEMVDIKRQQQKMDWITSLVSNPVQLYMMQKSGLLGNIDDLDGGAVSSAVEQILAAVPEQSLSNIQQINSRSSFENELDSFNISMQRGLTPEAYEGYISGTAPYTRGTKSRMAPGAPTDYSQFIQGPTTAADIAGPEADFGYSPPAMGNLESTMARGEQIHAETAKALGNPYEESIAKEMSDFGIGNDAWSNALSSYGQMDTDTASTDTQGQGTQSYENFSIKTPTDLSSTGGNAATFMLNDAPGQLLRGLPDIDMRVAQELSRKAMLVAQGDPDVGTDAEMIKTGYEILESWIRGYGVFAVDGVWWDGLEELGRGREGQQKAMTRRNEKKSGAA
jgi:hypothetical protein